MKVSYCMPRARKRQVPSVPRPIRSDGAVKREHILRVATQMYADKGFDRTTSKQVCIAARTNMAAVNYHFGSKEGLYDAVLIEAHHQLVSLDTLETIARSDRTAEAKLRALLKQFLARQSDKGPPVGLRVLVRELMAPSKHLPGLIRKADFPKIQVVISIIAAVLGLPTTHPAVQRALAFVVMPCIMMVIAPRDLLRRGLPALETQPDVLLEDMTRYVIAGLQSLRFAYQGHPP